MESLGKKTAAGKMQPRAARAPHRSLLQQALPMQLLRHTPNRHSASLVQHINDNPAITFPEKEFSWEICRSNTAVRILSYFKEGY